jgi:predicted ATPase
MLRRLSIKDFKSLADVEVRFPALTVLFGPNAAGKSNLLDAVQALSRIGTSRTLSEALSEPIRGYPIEAFAFPAGGLAALLNMKDVRFKLDADLDVGRDRYRYWIEVAIQPDSGALSVADEYLTSLTGKGEPKGNPSIEQKENEQKERQLRIRRKSKPAHPRSEIIGLNHSLLSDPRLGGVEYRAIEKCRNELVGWRVYYLDPRIAMRTAKPPQAVSDIGVLGENIAPFLYRLRADSSKHFDAIKRTLRTVVPSVENLNVELDKRYGTLDITVTQGGKEFSSRIISEGTLRVLALCAIAVNPWGGGLIAFEEPENGVHPRRIELIAKLIVSLAKNQKRQVIVTTHSPLFCDAILRETRPQADDVALLNVRQGTKGTEVHPFDVTGPLFKDQEIAKALTSETEDGLFESLMLRGMLDG